MFRFFFFFKQKTAYEMRISDWSSDVCSSDLTAEGLIGLHIAADAKQGAVVEVNCETDFVARNDDFINFVNQVAQLVATSNPADVAALADLPMGDGTVESTRTALIGKIGENVSVRDRKSTRLNSSH